MNNTCTDGCRIFLCLFAGVAGVLPQGKTGEEGDSDTEETHATNVTRRRDKHYSMTMLNVHGHPMPLPQSVATRCPSRVATGSRARRSVVASSSAPRACRDDIILW